MEIRSVDNRNLEDVCRAQEDQVAAMARRIVQLMGDVQRLERELDAAHAAITQAIAHL